MQEVLDGAGWNDFPRDEALRIARSADEIKWSEYYSPQVRQDLLAACGLVEA